MATYHVATRWLTADDFVSNPAFEHGYELIDGREHEDLGNTHPIHEWVKSWLFGQIFLYQISRPTDELIVYSECPYQFDPYTVRIPDISIQKPPRPLTPKKYFQQAPEIAIEVLSPSNSRREMDAKARAYWAHGAKAVWAIDWETREAFTIDSLGGWLRVSELADPELLPGFTLDVATLWPPEQ